MKKLCEIMGLCIMWPFMAASLLVVMLTPVIGMLITFLVIYTALESVGWDGPESFLPVVTGIAVQTYLSFYIVSHWVAL